MENRKYPTERKQAPVWECPVCKKSMSARGKTGHMEKVHGRGKPLKEFDPYPAVSRTVVQKRRPLSRSDVRNLISNVIGILVDNTRTPDVVKIRKALFQCEYLIRELEINANCTLEEACVKFKISSDEVAFYKTNKKN